jgi:exosortase D (VPLPA-CTERM-specific)
MSVQLIDGGARGAAVWRLSWGLTLVTIAVGLLSIWPFWDGLANMWQFWMNAPEYSHCLLIPPIAAFLIYQRKDRLERVNFSGSWWGVALVVLGGSLLVLGQLGTVFTIVQYAYLATFYGLVLAFLGWRAFRLIAMPLMILIFMIPLPSFFLFNLSTKLQLVSSQLGVYFIRLFEISVFLEGNVIDLGGYKLQVAEACSGLRYLFPLMTLGFLIAYIYKGALWKRIVLFISSIPITVIMNSFRIGIIGVTVDRWGTRMAEGFLHEFQGWTVFMISAALMFGEIAVLNLIGTERGTWRQLFSVDFPASTPRGAAIQPRKVPASFIAASILLAAYFTASFMIQRPAEMIPTRAPFVEFPMALGEWRGQHQSLEAVYTDQLQLDDYVMADYVDNAGNAVNLYIAYYASQRKGEAVHSPRSCLPGGGWQMRDFDQRTLDKLSINGHPLRVNRTLIELGGQRQLVYYWFQQRGRVITNEFAVKWYLFWDALTRHRSDGSLIRLGTALPAGTSEILADRRLTDLASRIMPDLPRYVPN